MLIDKEKSPYSIFEQIPGDTNEGDGGQRRVGHKDAYLEPLDLVLLADPAGAVGQADRGDGDGDAEEGEGEAGEDKSQRGGAVVESEEGEEAPEAVESGAEEPLVRFEERHSRRRPRRWPVLRQGWGFGILAHGGERGGKSEIAERGSPGMRTSRHLQ